MNTVGVLLALNYSDVAIAPLVRVQILVTTAYFSAHLECTCMTHVTITDHEKRNLLQLTSQPPIFGPCIKPTYW